MAFYFRAESVPELDGLSKWERRVMLRGTFMKERLISNLVLLGILLVLIEYAFNPLLQSVAPQVRSNSLPYMAAMVVFLLALMWVRDVVLMNLLRPKIAAKRAELAAKRQQAEQQTPETGA